ncbi:PAS domain S-box protein [Heliobacterium undosum]|uniref:histidine kinase n=1 Tax=Heliomicrobium undosum TaxID=121734 RepID=A0A845L0D8_9FIRM|nr:ATP-binding protein [Heliomicrobium undosum]MZP29026.1 PAS domain S-box protein [Heliomicrobium undosum]
MSSGDSYQRIREQFYANPRLRLFFKSCEVGERLMIIHRLKDRRVIDVNKRFEEVFGYRRDEIIGRSSFDLRLWTDSSLAEALWQKLRDDEVARDCEMTYNAKNGDIRFGLFSAVVTMLDDEKYIFGTIMDITQQKIAEEELLQKHNQLLAIFDSMDAYIHVVNPDDDRILFVNKSFTHRIGDPSGRRCYEATRGVSHRCPECLTQDRKKTNGPHSWETCDEKTNRWYHCTYNRIKWSDGRWVRCMISVDITEQKNYQKEMARLERLNLIGQMAAGFGHEIRNPLTTVRGYLQYLNSKPENGHLTQYFNLMIEELDRANQIVTEFLSLRKQGDLPLAHHDINAIIQNLYPLIQSDAFTMNMQLRLELADDLPPLALDEKEIRQLLLNLTRNGLEAMAPGGELAIRTEREDDKVILSIRDEGSGMAQDVLDNLGIPFFTTKDYGTGLGLAVCYRIAARHNAAIDVKSSPLGSTFMVRFKIALAENA